jgi:hypothetical protein
MTVLKFKPHYRLTTQGYLYLKMRNGRESFAGYVKGTTITDPFGDAYLRKRHETRKAPDQINDPGLSNLCPR